MEKQNQNQNQKEVEKRNQQKNNIIDITKARKIVNVNKNNMKKEVVEEIPIGSKPITPDELLEEILESFAMGSLDIVQSIITLFLASENAIRLNIIGVVVMVENGKVIFDWKFGERSIPYGK